MTEVYYYLVNPEDLPENMSMDSNSYKVEVVDVETTPAGDIVVNLEYIDTEE